MDPGVVMTGRDGCTDAIAMVERRLVETAQHGQRRLPLQAARHASAHLDDLALVIAGEVDLDRTLGLARAFMALDGKAWASKPPDLRRQPGLEAVPDDAWLAIRLSLLPWPLKDGRRIGCDPAIVRRLAAGDAAAAVDLALRRLRAAGLRATVRGAGADPAIARRWAAALAFPITQRTAERMVRRLDPSFAQEESHAR
jgi:CRISPR-associated protein Csx17